VICDTSVFDPAKLLVRLRPGLAAVSAVLALLKADVSDAAAKTLSDPVMATLVVLVLLVLPGAAVVVDEAVVVLDEQAASVRASAATTGTNRWKVRAGIIGPLSVVRAVGFR
jgi:hypothetical protein